jgi:cellulose biosynthesis protein BcsQ
VLIVLSCVLLSVAYVCDKIRRRRIAARYQQAANIDIFTVGNSKGGVGKSTILFFLAKEYARRFTDKNILVIDCSVYGDVSKRLLAGSTNDMKTNIRTQYTLECMISSCLTPIAFYEFWRKTFNVLNHVLQISSVDKSENVPTNLFLLSNQKQLDYRSDAFESAANPFSDEDISRVSKSIRLSLEQSNKKWIVLIDTDGGVLHDFTKIAMCTADSIITPLLAGVGGEEDARRLNELFSYVLRLHNKNMSAARFDFAFFNLATSINNHVAVPEIGSPFIPKKDVENAARRIIERFQNASGSPSKYSSILRLDGVIDECFGFVRCGGVGMFDNLTDPWNADAGNMQGDIEILVDKILRIKENHSLPPTNLDSRFGNVSS